MHRSREEVHRLSLVRWRAGVFESEQKDLRQSQVLAKSQNDDVRIGTTPPVPQKKFQMSCRFLPPISDFINKEELGLFRRPVPSGNSPKGFEGASPDSIAGGSVDCLGLRAALVSQGLLAQDGLQSTFSPLRQQGSNSRFRVESSTRSSADAVSWGELRISRRSSSCLPQRLSQSAVRNPM